MEDLPVCLIVGTGGRDPETIVKGIFAGQEIPQPVHMENHVSSYKLDISTKYYDTSIQLCCLPDSGQLSSTVQWDVHAFVLYMNDEETTMDQVDKIVDCLPHADVEVKILVCDQCSVDDSDSGKLAKLKAQQWCIQNGFELVEIDPLEVPDPEDDFPETLGIPRIVQALHAYTWPNLVMKDQKKLNSFICNGPAPGEEAAAEIQYEKLDADQRSSGSDEETTLEDMECFEQLFGQLSVIKDKASSLQGDQRRVYAEKMAVAFWRALGGDEQEIEGLDSDHS